MLRDKRIKERFKNEFGVNVDEWFDEANNDFGSNINKSKK